MKNNSDSKFYNRLIINILYSLVITAILEFFLVSNITKLSDYMAETGAVSGIAVRLAEPGTELVLLFVLFGTGLFVLVFWLFERRSIRYISNISAAMRAASKGDFNFKLEPDEDDELAQIAADYNSMVSEIQILMDRERETERSKNELITNIAHDLRTPLTSIIGYLELLSGKAELNEETRLHYTNVAYTKAKKLEQLLEDLFGFTKLGYGRISMKVERLDIVKLLAQLMEEFYPNFAQKNIAFELKSNKPSAFINADGKLLARLFDNLINNAIKYGADGKLIRVRIEAEEEIVKISVVNYGKVIPANELPLIFDKFYRVEQSRSSSTGGTGLGLAIAKNIVEMHSGKIEVTSDLNGTAFVVELKTDFDINKENFENA